MSGRLVGQVLQDGLEEAPVRARRSLRAVLVVLAEAAGPSGLAYPSRATIAERAMLSERQVVRCLRQLEELGRISCAGYRQGGRGHAPSWTLHLAIKGDTTPPFSEAERVTPRTVKGDTLVSPQPYEPNYSPPPPAERGVIQRIGQDHLGPALPAQPSLPLEGDDLGRPRRERATPAERRERREERRRRIAEAEEAERRRQRDEQDRREAERRRLERDRLAAASTPEARAASRALADAAIAAAKAASVRGRAATG